MRDIRFRLSVSLRDLLKEGDRILDINSDQGIGIPYEGIENVLHNFLDHYKILPLTKLAFSRATIEGEHLINIDPPENSILARNRKGFIVNATSSEKTIKFFILDGLPNEPKSVIEQFLWLLNEYGLSVKEVQIGEPKSASLSDCITYLRIEDSFTTADSLWGLNAEPSEVIRLDIIAEDKGSAGITVVNKEGKNITADFMKKD